MTPTRPTPERPSAETLAAEEAREDLLALEALDELAEEPLPAEKAVDEAQTALIERARKMRVDYPSLSESDIVEALSDARAEVEAKHHEALMKRIMADERARLRREEGAITGSSHHDEICTIMIHLQPWQNPARINGQCYYDGEMFTGPRHMCSTFQEMSQWGDRLERELRGDSWADYYRKRPVQNVTGKMIQANA